MTTLANRPRIRSAFGDLLRRELEDRGVSLKELSRRLVGTDATPEQVNGRRRLLQKYLAGDVSPSAHARKEIAAALGLSPEGFAEDAERAAELQQIADALVPLVDVLYALAVRARERSST